MAARKTTVHCCNDCGCEVEYETGYCVACDAYPAVTPALVDMDDSRPASHMPPKSRSKTARSLGSRGGKAAAKAMSPEQRQARARKAVAARWARRNPAAEGSAAVRLDEYQAAKRGQ